MKVLLVILSVFILTGCSRDPYNIPDDVVIETNDNLYEVFSDVNVNDLIASSNVDFNNVKVNTNETGKQTYTLDFKYKNKNYKKDITYSVYDNTPPVFLSYYGSTTVLVNQDIYPCDDAIYADNYDTNISCIIDGYFDLSIPGKYETYYLLKDSAGNETRKKLILNVVEKYKNNSNSNSNNSIKKDYDMNYFIKNYKTEDTMIGIDVSRWQGDIDYNKVKEDGVEFVIMRIGVNSSANGNLDIDSFFLQNIKNAKDAGLKVGVYLYTTAINEKTARQHAKWVVKTLDGVKLDFPIAYDWENWKWFMEYEINLHTLSSCFETFNKELNKHGYDAMLYSSKFYLENIWINKNNLPVWLAHYTDRTDYKGDYLMWQLSSIGKVDGINGNVDINIYYKNKKTS